MIYRVVNEEGEVQYSYVGRKHNKPYYMTLRAARIALHSFPEGCKVEQGEVTWSELPNA